MRETDRSQKQSPIHQKNQVHGRGGREGDCFGKRKREKGEGGGWERNKTHPEEISLRKGGACSIFAIRGKTQLKDGGAKEGGNYV